MGVACLILSGLAWIAPRPAAAQPTAHLTWAERLVDNIAPEDNEYGSRPFITWAGVAGARRYANRTQCATFLTALLKRSYGWSADTFEDWLDSASPNAATYHDAILAEDGFERIESPEDARAGDILALRYPESASSSGHVAILRRAPKRRFPMPPYVVGTTQYEVFVVDSTNYHHGTSDSRRRSGGRWSTGAGFGSMRIYVDRSDTVVGHTWSMAATTVYHPTTHRQVAIGRLALRER
ncbi:hypothetical protein WMF31_08255 [Sorangium sp. So ce1036]|uniref:hypothetical protein n=1 Tax=Sorangium sp. So ce1036 TaxID=3133328 RepID=UPI003F013ED9